METKRLPCREIGRFRIAPRLLLPVLGLLILGCGDGTREVKPPREMPPIAKDRFDGVQVAIDGKPVDSRTTITVGQDFVVTVSFRRLHVWPGMENPESLVEVLMMEKSAKEGLTHRYPILEWQSEKDGVLTFTGKVEGLPDSGVFGFWIREIVTTETPGVDRHVLFATNLRNVKP